jgi:hypothetical protein
MSAELDAFLYRLAKEPDLLERFRHGPQAVLGESRLSPHDRELLLSRRGEELWAMVPKPPLPPVTVSSGE